MAYPARVEEGDDGKAREDRELTVIRTQVVARSGSFCGRSN